MQEGEKIHDFTLTALNLQPSSLHSNVTTTVIILL